MTDMVYDAHAIQAVIRQSMDAARERANLQTTLKHEVEPTTATAAWVHALIITDALAKLHGEPPEHLLVQLQGEFDEDYLREMAYVLGAGEIHLSSVHLTSDPSIRHPTDRIVCFAHMAEATLFVTRLMNSSGMGVTLVKTY